MSNKIFNKAIVTACTCVWFPVHRVTVSWDALSITRYAGQLE
jgi:hypothetical protein